MIRALFWATVALVALANDVLFARLAVDLVGRVP
tara:strand:- start:2278 stop:2379 length:102 start_codon:yes stop_codon:yes gene_type:complete